VQASPTSDFAPPLAHRPLPFEAAIRLGAKHARYGTIVALLGTLLLHGGGAAYGANSNLAVSRFARDVMHSAHARLAAEIDIDLDQPEPEKEPEPPPPPPEPEPEARIKPPPMPDEPPPAPPAAAQAGQILAAEADPNEPLDLTGDNTFVVGNAETYSGGITASTGKSKTAVHDLTAKPTGVVGGTGTAPSSNSSVDLSRPAAPVSRSWNCPFPPEADIEQINYMRVSVVVQVNAEGNPKSVEVLNDPGFGFGRAARQCALKQAYRSALSRDGKAIAHSLATVVKFER
jgi:protein TonB